jgi:DNA-directed RNA polymerase specialized sigma24 family protein
VDAVDQTQTFEAERPRLVAMSSRSLGDHAEAQDIVQQAWLRLHGTDADIENLPGSLTTVTTRGRRRHPKKSLGWYNDTKKAFAAMPKD